MALVVLYCIPEGSNQLGDTFRNPEVDEVEVHRQRASSYYRRLTRDPVPNAEYLSPITFEYVKCAGHRWDHTLFMGAYEQHEIVFIPIEDVKIDSELQLDVVNTLGGEDQ
jgi:hypothetical protein